MWKESWIKIQQTMQGGVLSAGMQALPVVKVIEAKVNSANLHIVWIERGKISKNKSNLRKGRKE